MNDEQQYVRRVYADIVYHKAIVGGYCDAENFAFMICLRIRSLS